MLLVPIEGPCLILVEGCALTQKGQDTQCYAVCLPHANGMGV